MPVFAITKFTLLFYTVVMIAALLPKSIQLEWN